jgi:hypothetical protein
VETALAAAERKRSEPDQAAEANAAPAQAGT